MKGVNTFGELSDLEFCYAFAFGPGREGDLDAAVFVGKVQGDFGGGDGGVVGEKGLDSGAQQSEAVAVVEGALGGLKGFQVSADEIGMGVFHLLGNEGVGVETHLVEGRLAIVPKDEEGGCKLFEDIVRRPVADADPVAVADPMGIEVEVGLVVLDCLAPDEGDVSPAMGHEREGKFEFGPEKIGVESYEGLRLALTCPGPSIKGEKV
ncbi:MAG: hypothetical protein HYU43_05535 [Armatimonadetes bacterium]|nr:hypothetical protein [Armatimonadota bacterium]